MRVGILAGCLGRRDGGPETYERELIRGIARIDSVNEYQIYTFEDSASECLGPLPGNFVVRVLRPRNRWISLAVTLPATMLRDGVDVLHASLYPPPLCPAPMVFTMHDISPIAKPEFFAPAVYRRLNPLVRGALKRARIVICVSQDAMDTTVALAGVEKSRMRVVPHGVNPMFRAIDKTQARAAIQASFGLTGSYLLYVGKIMARKNVTRLIEAYGRFVEETKTDVPLVLAGKRLYDTDDVDETIAKLGLTGRVRELGHVPDAILPALYSGAMAVTYVTLWEGFGLPILEAMACGTPVIASNVSSIPEVAGGAAILVDPMDVGAIADAIRKIYQNPALRETMARQGLDRAAQFTWTQTAEQTVLAYKRAVSPRRHGEVADAGSLV